MIRLIKPYIKMEDVKLELEEIFESGWFTQGQYNHQFREDLCNYLGCKYAYLTTSATTALSLSLKVLGVGIGDEVIVSDFSFPATANVVEDIGAIPIFADVSLQSFNMLPDDLERKITSRTKAIIFVDAFGNPSNIFEIKTLCEKFNIPLIEDAACAIGSSNAYKKCGSIADITCFSFHPRKLLTTGEGGAITTNHAEISELLAIKLRHGAQQKGGKWDFISYGYNYRMTEIQALMGIKQLKQLDHIISTRQEILDQYVKQLSGIGFEQQAIEINAKHNVQSLVFKTPPGCVRDDLIQYLYQNDIESTIGTYCMSGTTYYQHRYNSIQANAKKLEESTITLPCYEDVPAHFIAEKIKAFVK